MYVNIILSRDYDRAFDKALSIARMLKAPWLVEEITEGEEGFYVLPLEENVFIEYVEKKAEKIGEM